MKKIYKIFTVLGTVSINMFLLFNSILENNEHEFINKT